MIASLTMFKGAFYDVLEGLALKTLLGQFSRSLFFSLSSSTGARRFCQIVEFLSAMNKLGTSTTWYQLLLQKFLWRVACSAVAVFQEALYLSTCL